MAGDLKNSTAEADEPLEMESLILAVSFSEMDHVVYECRRGVYETAGMK